MAVSRIQEWPRPILGLVPWGLAIFLPLMALAQAPEPVLGQSIPTISLQTYHEVLDFIFAPTDKPKGAIVFSLNIRIAPAFRPESQMNLTLLNDRTTRAEYVVADKNVYYASNKVLQATRDGRAEDIAKRTPVKRYKLSVSPTQLIKWQQGFMESLRPTSLILERDVNSSRLGQPQSITIDGDSYEVWYSQFPTDIDISFGQSATPTPLETWASAVHSTAAKMALPSNR
jgi:hypothetical protein